MTTATIRQLTDALGDPTAYPHPAGEIEIRHTHISIVFLAGDFAYKVKKPLDLGFLDFTTLERRLHFCRQEVRLNRRLAPGVYLGVVPVLEDDGRLRLGEPLAEPDVSRDGGRPGEAVPADVGELPDDAVEFAVKMERLPDEATLRRRLRRGDLRAGIFELVAERVADFHDRAASGPEISRFGRFDTVARNARENFEQTVPHVGRTVSATVHDRLAGLTGERLEDLEPLIEDRADRDVPRDTHGDLHLDHVYHFPDREPPADLLVLDCIEFNDRLRYGDPMADVGFLVMDLAFEGRRDLGDRFAEAYFEASGDDEGRRLLPYYTAYRAAVRGKVEGMTVHDDSVPEEERAEALRKSRAHWLLALGELETPVERPCLLLLGGLPGTGKTTLGRGLEREAGFRVISSDRKRKELAGLSPDQPAAAEFEEGIYTPEWTEKTYAACREEVRRILFEGGRVVVDASFREEEQRRRFLELGRRWGVPVLWILCRADESSIRERLSGSRDGASDADWEIYRHALERWEEAGSETDRVRREVVTDGPAPVSLAQALAHLAEAGLHPGPSGAEADPSG